TVGWPARVTLVYTSSIVPTLRISWRRVWTSWRCGASGRWRTCTRGSRAPANQPSREACGDGLGPASPTDLDHRVEGPFACPRPDHRLHGDRGHPRTAHR